MAKNKRTIKRISSIRDMANYQEQKEQRVSKCSHQAFQEELGYTYLGNWQYAKGANVSNMGVAAHRYWMTKYALS